MFSIERLLMLCLLVCGTVSGARKKPKPVVILKCCKNNEYLPISGENICVQNASSSWNIDIFNGRLNHAESHTELPPHWTIKEGMFPECAKPKKLFFESKSSIPFMNGSIFSIEYNKWFHPDQICIDYKAFLVCLNGPHNFVKKCCGENAIFSETNGTCITFKDQSYKIDVGQNWTLGAGFPTCTDNKLHVVGELHKSKIFNNGSLLVDNQIMLSAGNFCLEHVLEHTGRSASVFTCSDLAPLSTPSARPVRPQNETDLRFTIYPIGLAFSVIFLAATLAAGALMPASHHVLHWRCQTNHVACLLLGDVLLCVTHLSGRISFWPCFMIAVFMHFLFLAAFFWLNTMCFNIWWTFRDLRPQSTERGQERRRLRFYEAYAFGIPLLITVVAASLDFNKDSVMRPRFAENNCWFPGDIEKLTFFFGPIGTLLFVNLLLFALTARELTCGLWKRELVKSTTERAALGRVCMKLVVVMGISWILDLISFAVGGPQEIWYVTDVLNSIHGVFIFIVVGCQPQVLSAVKRFWCSRMHRQNGTAGTTNHHSTSSQGNPSMGDTLTNTNSVITNGTTLSPTKALETSC